MLTQLFFAAVAFLVPYLCHRLWFKRLHQFAHFPQLPPSVALGHLQVVDDFVKRSPQGAHPDVAFAAMHEALGRPPVMFVDLRPVASPMLVVASYKVAEQIARSSDRFPYSPPKTPEIWTHMVHLTGPKSIASSQGEEWKALRKRFNPGFAPQHLLSLLPAIVHRTSIFVDRLSELAETGDEFSLQRLATDLTFDVIGGLALDIDMKAQTAHPAKLTHEFQALIRTYTDEQIDLPWWFTPRLEWKRKSLALKVRELLKAIVQESHAKQNVGTNRPRSILSMSLEGIDTLSPKVLDTTCDQLSTFLFAGHDTTSTTIAWMLYEVSRTPRALKAVRAELDELFGPDPSPAAVASRLLMPGGEELINRMTYTSAVIRETLRFWPPGATSRTTKPGDGLSALVANRELNLDGIMVYHVPYIIQRDPKVFGETANTFVPERWLQKASGDFEETIPAAAFVAFGRGPRNCIGQELSTIEARVVMALVGRQFAFSKLGTGAVILDNVTGQPGLDAHGRYKVTEEMYNAREVTSKPVDGMRMRIKVVT
ncbi:cytochrome P450 52A11 [Diaporthe helianthi]|uniref:Cytochrome P450 52A11 n=1 Tax=Diaporthe helianthi TaxID=158607 RepID=A0A2P5HX94_DIAHE|nr:cytochrome P450 52A11 [Diaporthe helianthi]